MTFAIIQLIFAIVLFFLSMAMYLKGDKVGACYFLCLAIFNYMLAGRPPRWTK